MKPDLTTPAARRIACAERRGWMKVRQHWELGEEHAYLNDSHCHRQLPNPEANPAGALALVEWWNQQRNCLALIKVEPNGTTVHLLRGNETIGEAIAPTFCAAVVLAFLAATEEGA